jgi:hypothetical protein
MAVFRALLAGTVVLLAACGSDITAPSTTARGVRILGLTGPELPRSGGSLENEQSRGNGEWWKHHPAPGAILWA